MAQKENAEKWIDIGGTEWADEEKGKHRIYFNGLALRKLYGLFTEGETPLTETQTARYKIEYGAEYLPALPETATLNGKPVEPMEAFKLLLSKPYFDRDTGRFMDLAADISERCANGNPLLAKCLSIGGKEWFSEDKHRVYFSGKALKELYGLQTEGERTISEEGIEQYKKEFHTQFLPPFPETAKLAGKEIDAEEAFHLMLSRPCFDVGAGNFTGLQAPLSDRMVFTAADQLKAMMAEAAEKDRLPWAGELTPDTGQEPPYNPVTGERFTGNNLIAAVLHMRAIGSKDPRYVREEDLKSAELKNDSIALKVCYRVKNEQEQYVAKTETLYNAAHIQGAPERSHVPPGKGEEVIAAAPGQTADGQMINNMAAYFGALVNGRSYAPCFSGFDQDGKSVIQSKSAQGLFSLLHKANVQSRGVSGQEQGHEAPQRQAAGMEI
jgi:hypothetical protein